MATKAALRPLINTMVLLAAIALGGILLPFEHGSSLAQGDCQTFRETGRSVCGRFLEYWQKNGGLAQNGLPISNEFQEVSDLNGETYTVQYFERAVFEKHPENQAPYDVLLSQLGTFQFKEKYPNGEPRPQFTPQPTAQPQPQSKLPSATVNQYFNAMALSGGTSIRVQRSLLSKSLLTRLYGLDPYWGFLGQNFPRWKTSQDAPRTDYSGGGPAWVLLLDDKGNTVAVFTLVKEDGVWKIEYAEPNALPK